jgi:hypothetical protein
VGDEDDIIDAEQGVKREPWPGCIESGRGTKDDRQTPSSSTSAQQAQHPLLNGTGL